jgi:diguanylate cyclase
VTLSVVLAIIFSLAALWLTFYFRTDPKGILWQKLGSAVVMGGAISAMHYTGMAAASFIPSAEPPDLSHAVSISSLGTIGIATVTLIVLGLTVLTSAVDRRFSAHALELQSSEEHYRLLFERSLAGVYRLAPDGRILDCNDACLRILGYASREEYLSHAGRDSFLRSGDWDVFLATLKERGGNAAGGGRHLDRHHRA